MVRPPPPQPGYVWSDDETTSDEEESDGGRDDGHVSDEEEDHQQIELGRDETWFGKSRVGLHGQVDPEYDPDRTDPLTLGDAFGSRILRDHLLIGAMEASLLDAFTPRQRGLVCMMSLVVTGLLTCTLVAQRDISPELAVVGSTLASFVVSVVLQHIYEVYQPRVRTVVPYLDERTGQYGLAKLSEAEGVANDIKEAAAEQKRKVTLEESRRRKRLQERARRRTCQVSLFSFVLLGAVGGLGYLGYLAVLRIIEAGELEPVFWCAMLSLIGQFVVLHTLKVLFAAVMAVMSDHRRRRKLERSRRVGVHSESAAEALAAKLGKPQQPKRNPPPPPPGGHSATTVAAAAVQDGDDGAAPDHNDDDDDDETGDDDSDSEEDEGEVRARKSKPPPPPLRAEQQARLRAEQMQSAAADAAALAGEPEQPRPDGSGLVRSPTTPQQSTAAQSASTLTAASTPATPTATAAALAAPTPSAAATALPPLATPPARQQPTQPSPSVVPTTPAAGTATAGHAIRGAHTPAPAVASPATSAAGLAPPAPASVPRPGRAPASVPRPARKAPTSVPRPPPKR